MKALTLWQPWASLIAVGAKTIETRGWSTKYRGPVLVHAAKRPMTVGDAAVWWCAPAAVSDPGWPNPDDLPLGAVVATCTLVDVVPIIDWGQEDEIPEGPYVYADPDFIQVHDGPDDNAPRYLEDEVHYGDYRSGRYAWLLANIRPLAEPVPAKGRQGLWTPDADLIARVAL